MLKIVKYISIFMTIVLVSLVSIIYHKSEEPLELPIYTLSNGEKQIVFITMSHIGQEPYYKDVINTLNKHRANGFLHLYEMVKPSDSHDESVNKNASEKINLATGNALDIIDQMSEKLGLKKQIYYYNQMVISGDLNADVSFVELANNLDTSDEKENTLKQENIDTLKEYLDQDFSEFDKEIGLFILKVGLTKFKNESEVQEKIDQDKSYGTIIDFRNEKLFQVYKEHEDRNIIITYGLAHFNGFLKLLKKDDPKWEIVNTENLIVIN